MLQLFRTNQPIGAILLIIYALLLRAAVFIVPTDWQAQEAGYLSELVYQYIDSTSWLSHLLAIVLVLVQAYSLNILVNRYKLTKRPSYFIGVAYILLASFFPSYLYLSPTLMANTFIIFSISEIFSFYKNNNANGAILNAGFYIAIASLFFFGSGVYLVLGFIGLSQMRSIKIREFLILIIGFAIPFFLLGTYLFYTNGFDIFWQKYIVEEISFLAFNIQFNNLTYIILVVYAFLILWSIVNSGTFLQKTGIQTRKNVSILFTAIIVGSISMLYQNQVTIEQLAILNAPLAVLLAFNWTVIKNGAVTEFLHLIMLAFVLFLQYQPLL